MSRELAKESTDEAIENSIPYYNSKVRQISFKEGELVLLKIQNFLGKNKKLAETYKGQYKITKVNDNGTVTMKTKCARHDQLVNQNQLVKYKIAPEKMEKDEKGAVQEK